MLERYRTRADAPLTRISRPFAASSPAVLSWIAFAFAVLAAFLYAGLRPAQAVSPWLLPIVFFAVAVTVFLSGLFDALDGFVARRQGRTSPQGDVLDHVLDRYSDLVLFLGIAISGWAIDWLALLALVSLLLVSYMGTQAQAVTGRRLYGGWLGRADRLVLLSGSALFLSLGALWDLVAPSALAVPLRVSVLGVSLTLLDAVLVYTLVASQVTAAWRAWTTWSSAPAPAAMSLPSVVDSSSKDVSGSQGSRTGTDEHRPSP